MDGQTMVKQYAPDLSMRGHKKVYRDFFFQKTFHCIDKVFRKLRIVKTF